ncbi:site-specific integrase [Mesorhizobium sp. M3A.F.Ca.ET.080.04.2.1]|uniref:tyrosine-type recombinase/integrase n=1 Tax=Mesorhizobium sp. M3A.F.Ca.ET.080.04.2.1 TaxID=2493676 RepID=UPI001FDF5E51|nr:site-specific integrase [Mesorhizobium sp. M3A.F.Ca.ET.080.04.2.1]
MRRYLGAMGVGKSPYHKETLGFADDYQDADGLTVLSYADAQRVAHERAKLASPITSGAFPQHPTVRDVVADYITFLKAERRSGRDAERRANNFILPELGGLKVGELTTDRLVQWRDAMAIKPARLRTGKDRATGERKEQRYRPAPTTPGEGRARRATVNRTLTVLKAALNRAFEHGRVNDDLAWRRLKPFDKVDVARPGHLSVAEAQRLIKAADADSGFRHIAHGALLTGCRYGELCRLLVGDFERGRIVVRESKSGKPRDVRLTDEGVAFFKSLTAGRPTDGLMFAHADGSAWAKSHQARPMRDACAAAKIIPAVGFHQLRHTWASLAVMNGMPLMIVAENLGHADTRMVEKHYGHLTEDYRDQAIRVSGPRFGVTMVGNVVPMEMRR